MYTLAFISPGGGELILVMLVLIMLFGAEDAPRILRKLHQFMDELRRMANGFRYDMMYSDLHSEETNRNPAPFDMNGDEPEEGEFEQYEVKGESEDPTDKPEEHDEDAEETNQ